MDVKFAVHRLCPQFTVGCFMFSPLAVNVQLRRRSLRQTWCTCSAELISVEKCTAHYQAWDFSSIRWDFKAYKRLSYEIYFKYWDSKLTFTCGSAVTTFLRAFFRLERQSLGAAIFVAMIFFYEVTHVDCSPVMGKPVLVPLSAAAALHPVWSFSKYNEPCRSTVHPWRHALSAHLSNPWLC